MRRISGIRHWMVSVLVFFMLAHTGLAFARLFEPVEKRVIENPKQEEAAKEVKETTVTAPITAIPISVAISPDRPNYRWKGDTYSQTCTTVDFGKVIEAETPKLLEAMFGNISVARSSDEEVKAKQSGLLLTIDISRVSSRWLRPGGFDVSFDSNFEITASIISDEKKIWTNSIVDNETFPGEWSMSCDGFMKDVYRDMTSHLKRVLKKALAPLSADQNLLIAIAEAEYDLTHPAADLLADLKSVEARYRVAEADSSIRKRPDQKSPLVRKVGVGSILQIIGQLPSGWLQVAKDGDAIGWIQEGAVTAMQQTGATVASPTVSPYPSTPPTPGTQDIASTFPTNSVLVNFPRSKPNPDDIAVIIGNANYKATAKDIPDVVPAYADAEGMKRYAMQALGIKEENVIFIKDARLADLISTFGNESNPKGKLWNWVKANRSQVFVFYSGHGAPNGDGTSSYLVPVDATASLIDLSGYSLKTLYANLGKLPAKSVTVVLEACFSGATQNGMLVKNASPIYQKAMQEIVPTNLTVISAGSGNQIASWEQDKSHGLFTKQFLQGMAGAADKKPYGNGDGKVTNEELSRYLAETVSYAAQRLYGREQTAQIITSGK